MAKYITHHRFKGLALCGKELNIPYGTALEVVGNYLITLSGEPVCIVTSENARKHFARNDDGRGLERGALTYAIAYGSRNTDSGYRFIEKEIELLQQDWARFLRKNVPVILFNEDFFSAPVDELQELADVLKIKIRR